MRWYGVLLDSQIDDAIENIVDNLSLGADKNHLRALLKETAMVESNYAKTPDFTPNSGKGVFQLDKIGFEDAISQNSAIKAQALKMGYNLDLLDYSKPEVTQDILLNTMLARLLYYKKPGSIPSTREGRAAYWKKYYNSVLGAGTIQAYLDRSSKLA